MNIGDELKFFIFLIGVFVSSVLLIKRGLLWLKRKRIIEDTPTSRIDTAAIGSFTEIIGRCINHVDKRIIAPLSTEACSGYILKIQKLVKSGKKSQWKNVGEFYSDEYLFIDDRSRGIASIRLCDLELENWDKTTVIKTKSFFKKSNPGLSILKSKYAGLNKILSDKSAHNYRLTEFRIARNKKMYVLATSKPFINFVPGLKNKAGNIDIVIGTESGFSYDSEIKDRIKIHFDRSDQDGLLLKLDKVYFSNLTEKELIKRKGLLALCFLGLGIVGIISVISYFLFRIGIINL